MSKKTIKRINVSPKRQITIPKDFYDQMEIHNNRVQIHLDGKRMVVEPVSVKEDLFDFTEQIRSKLEKDGFTGKKLAHKLAEQKQLVEQAFGQLIQEAEEDYRSGRTVSHEELFSDTDGTE